MFTLKTILFYFIFTFLLSMPINLMSIHQKKDNKKKQRVEKNRNGGLLAKFFGNSDSRKKYSENLKSEKKRRQKELRTYLNKIEKERKLREAKNKKISKRNEQRRKKEEKRKQKLAKNEKLGFWAKIFRNFNSKQKYSRCMKK